MKYNVLGVMIDAVDYGAVVERVVESARAARPLAVSALAVHGVMSGRMDAAQRARLNRLDVVAPDGQPVRWALNLLHGTSLRQRVYGPTLMLRVCERAAHEGLPIYLYGSTQPTVSALRDELQAKYPSLRIAGAEPSQFRRLAVEEKQQLASRIRASGARITFVGLGCPRQEVWAYEYRELVSMPILAVGAAFDFHAGRMAQAPAWMQDRGLEWLFRLHREPRRLWRRYLFLNPAYVALVAAQLTKAHRFDPSTDVAIEELSFG